MKIRSTFMKTALLFAALLLSMLHARADSVGEALEVFVKEGHIAGAVTLVAKREQILSMQAVGWQVLETRRPMEQDSLFWIASMTKPVIALAILMLHDDGRLDIHDPVERYLPEFKGQMLLQEKSDDRVVLVKPARPVTIKDLLTHTSGIAGNANAEPGPADSRTPRESAVICALTPLQFEPGSKWAYSNPGINTLGRIIEVVTGEDLSKAMSNYVFRPLNMKSTTFVPTTKQIEQLAVSYKMDDELRRIVPSGIPYLSEPYTSTKRQPFGAGGLFSTAEDLHKLCLMMVSGGEANRRKHLSKETLALMFQNHTGDMKAGFVEGMGMGLGLQVVARPTGVTAKLSAGTAGHGGAHGTQMWFDPASGSIQIMLIQRAGLPNGDASPMRQAFHDAAAKVLQDAASLPLEN
ncbi:MAG TPA: serine hydrolase [Verrucomicrobiales bacterium]|nr:serine hydrolase [Verrucomicrobiales bacterium]